MYSLATLYALRQHIGLDASDTTEDERLIDALKAASASIERRTRRKIQPYLASILHDVNLRDVSELLLKDDLLELQSLTNGDGNSIALSDVIQIADAVLKLINGAVFTYDETPVSALTVTGLWAYHPDWLIAWADSGDSVQDASLTASATTITVTDADAGSSPRFQVGQLIRLEDEYLHIIVIDTATNILTVKRGVNGTTASTHANATQIDIYQMPADIAQLTIRWALWLYREPDSFSSKLPSILQDSLDGLRRFTVGS